MKAFKRTLDDIRFSGTSTSNRISVISFQNNYCTIYERQEPKNINVANITYENDDDGTDFEPVFNAAAKRSTSKLFTLFSWRM